MKKVAVLFVFSIWFCTGNAQYKVRLSDRATLGVSPNIETYFFVEKLAVESIGNYVFDIKDVDYSHQPIVYFGFKHFAKYKAEPSVIRISEILKIIRDTLHDNGPIMDYLLNCKIFPAKGLNVNLDNGTNLVHNDKLKLLLPELRDSLIKFYIKADVGGFLKRNGQFYKGALNEVAKDINKSAFPVMEKWYGKHYPKVELYISPAMPITPGADSYRGYGPMIWSVNGKIPSMVMSSSKMLKQQPDLNAYHQYGFDNAEVTKFIAIHEISHSFVNPLLETYATKIRADSNLFTKELKPKLLLGGTWDWYTCVMEHLVRLGEIRIAVELGDNREADRLRKLHIHEYGFVLLPMLEEKIKEYEADRKRYPDYKSYLPELIGFFHQLTPDLINEQVTKFNPN